MSIFSPRPNNFIDFFVFVCKKQLQGHIRHCRPAAYVANIRTPCRRTGTLGQCIHNSRRFCEGFMKGGSAWLKDTGRLTCCGISRDAPAVFSHELSWTLFRDYSGRNCQGNLSTSIQGQTILTT